MSATSNLANARTMRQLAATYHAWGINIVPLGNDKRPIIISVNEHGRPLRYQWDDWQTQPQTPKLFTKITAPAWWTEVQGIALVCGSVSGNLVLIDFDDCQPTTEFWQTLALDEHHYAWGYPTPGGGYHVWLRTTPPLNIAKGKIAQPGHTGGNVEIRWTGHYGAAPGSLHPNGTLYAWRNGGPDQGPAVVPAAAILAAYDLVTQAPPPTKAAPAPTASTAPSTPGSYGATALANELRVLQHVTAGGRNEALNKAAFALGQLVAGGELDEHQVENALLDAAQQLGLPASEAMATIRSGMQSGAKHPRTSSHSTHSQAPSYPGFGPAPAGEPQTNPAATPPGAVNTWPYSVHDNRMFYQYENNGNIQERCIADFRAHIAIEQREEDGASALTLAGVGYRGGPFSLTLPAEDFGSDLKLRAALTAATGGIDPVYPRMTNYLGAVIGRTTDPQQRITQTLYRRTGWRNQECASFLLPGLPIPRTVIELPHKLPYGGPTADAELTAGLQALAQLCTAVDPQLTTPVLSALLLAPLHRLAGWRNERTAIFIAGRTGSLKTSWTQTALCLYGADFANDEQLIKWGEGATRNAIMGLATQAHDLPLLIDNYKPTTGGGKHDFQNLIHNILEGGEKDRLNRAAQLRPTRPIHCLPVITGEDVPDDDAAALARILIVQFEWQRGAVNEPLAAAQAASHHLPAVGWQWLQWLMSDAGRSTVKAIAGQFQNYRRQWADYLRTHNQEMANILRVATNLAINELTWQIACQHPELGPVLSPHAAAHRTGLLAIAQRMAMATTVALEAHQYLTALQELLQSRQYVLVDRAAPGVPDNERDRLLGWHDREGVYLLPAIALAAVKRLLGPGSLLCSPQTLYNQMQQLGWITKTDEDHTARKIAIGSQRPRVLHLRPGLIRTVTTGDLDDDDDDIDPDAADDIISQLGI